MKSYAHKCDYKNWPVHTSYTWQYEAGFTVTKLLKINYLPMTFLWFGAQTLVPVTCISATVKGGSSCLRTVSPSNFFKLGSRRAASVRHCSSSQPSYNGLPTNRRSSRWGSSWLKKRKYILLKVNKNFIKSCYSSVVTL